MATSFRDPTLQHIHSLEPFTRDRAIELVNILRGVGVPVIITSGRRGLAEQAELVRRGASRTLRSKHLQGRAFDIDIAGLDRDLVPHAFWELLGPWAERELGLVWGGRFPGFWDPAHFESPGVAT